MEDISGGAEERQRASVTIGLNPHGGPFTSIDATTAKTDDVPPERIVMANEFRSAREALKASGQLPISISNNCLTHMNDGHDTAHILKLFKMACLSYQPTDISYRDHTMTRPQLL